MTEQSGFVKANKKVPLVKGARDKTVIKPLAEIQSQVELNKQNVQMLSNNVGQMVNSLATNMNNIITDLRIKNNYLTLQLSATQTLLRKIYEDGVPVVKVDFDDLLLAEIEKIELKKRNASEKQFDKENNYHDVDRPVQEKDIVIINVKCVDKDNNEIKDFKLDYFPCPIDKELPVIPTLIQNLMGMRPGCKKDFSIKFDDTYIDKKHIGKEYMFSVELVKVKEKIVVEKKEDKKEETKDENNNVK